MKELLQNDFFLEDTGLKVEVANTDGEEKEGVIQLRLRVVDPKKRKDKHKENEAIQFDFDTSNDVPENVAQEMVNTHLDKLKTNLWCVNTSLVFLAFQRRGTTFMTY